MRSGLFAGFGRRERNDLDALGPDRPGRLDHGLPAAVAATDGKALVTCIVTLSPFDQGGDAAAAHYVAQRLRPPTETGSNDFRRQKELASIIPAQDKRSGTGRGSGHRRASHEIGSISVESSPRWNAIARRKEWAMRSARSRNRSATSNGQRRSTVVRKSKSQRWKCAS
jgi:hypothetical protein